MQSGVHGRANEPRGRGDHDARLQRLVSKTFPHTLLATAHRLYMAVDFVQVVVMADGAVQKARTPAALLAITGPLAERAAALGPYAAAKLRALAAKGTTKSKHKACTTTTHG
jgi:hypothetical protein